MDRKQHSNDEYSWPKVPPGTPPVVDRNADAGDAMLGDRDGDSDAPGSQPAHFEHGRRGDLYRPGGGPDEIDPPAGDATNPGSPDEFEEGDGDTIEPGGAPDETPPRPDETPLQTPPPPD